MIDPNELLNTKFEKKRGGYRAEDVDSFMVQAASLFSQQSREIMELKRKLEAGQQKIKAYETDQDSLKEALLSAQRLADNIVREARAKAEKIEKDASGRANSLIGEMRGEIVAEQNKLTQMKKEVTNFRSSLMNMYRAHLELINDIPVFHEEPEEKREETSEAAKEEAPAPEEKAGPEKPEAAEAETEEEKTFSQAAAAEAEQDKHEQEQPEPPAGEEAEPPKSEPAPELKLNVRFDEQAGEYIPIADERRHGGGPGGGRKK